MKLLSDRYRKILKLRKKGLTFAQIAMEIGTSRQRAWELWKRASDRVTEKAA